MLFLYKEKNKSFLKKSFEKVLNSLRKNVFKNMFSNCEKFV